MHSGLSPGHLGSSGLQAARASAAGTGRGARLLSLLGRRWTLLLRRPPLDSWPPHLLWRFSVGRARGGQAPGHARGGTRGRVPAVAAEPQRARRSRGQASLLAAAGYCSSAAAASKRTIQHILYTQRERASDTRSAAPLPALLLPLLPPPSAPPSSPPARARSLLPPAASSLTLRAGSGAGKRGRSGTSRLLGPITANACTSLTPSEHAPCPGCGGAGGVRELYIL